MRKDKEEHFVTALEWRSERKRRPGRVDPKQHGGEWLTMRKTAGWQSWANVTTIAANRSGWKDNVKALYALWHKEI